MAKENKIKKLTKEQLEEGITLDIVNSINMARHSPVQLKKGDEPCNLLPCTGGYWVMIDGVALKGADNKRIIYPEKECIIGRARYLVNFGKEEKEKKIQELIGEWKVLVEREIEAIAHRIKECEPAEKDDSISSIFRSAIKEQRGAEYLAQMDRIDAEEYAKLKTVYERVTALWASGKIVELLEGFGIKQFKNPILSAHFVNEQEMKTFVNTFSADQINKFFDDGCDWTYKYAQIEIEKQYAV